MRLSRAAELVNGTLSGRDDDFTGCGIDSRTIQQGQLFVAIHGERFDGHDFIASAAAKGAAAALVDRDDTDPAIPLIRVDNTRTQLAVLAGQWRDNFSIPLIAVTGSNGKTTVKEMLHSILSVNSEVLSTQGNLNNDLGVPLTLFRLSERHRYAVIEMGANQPQEIQRLCEIAKPTVAVITLCAPAHLDGFGSVAGVAAAKAEIYAGLNADDTAVINADDDFYHYWCEQAGQARQISFGIDGQADISARDVVFDPQQGVCNFTLVAGAEQIPIKLPLPGQHNVSNALAAAACCRAINIPPQQIKQGLEAIQPVSGRLQILPGKQQSRVFDDTYNANPVSLRAAMQVVSRYPGEKYLVLGDMAELGQQAAELHFAAGQQAGEMGFSKLFAVGVLAAEAVRGFGEGAIFYREKADLIDDLSSMLAPDLNVLVKGSRTMAMDTVVAALSEVQ
ncbi:MAG: UDP-N-acetylmuramoyl-tripeptide--D-alanyl-D-alanine ligase [Gammaproteobacteria bacterium]